MNDPTVFANFLETVLQVRPTRVREEIVTFVEILKTSLAHLIIHDSNSARVSNAKLLISSNVILGLKSILFELKDRDVCGALPSAMVLNNLDTVQISFMRKLRNQALINQTLRKDVTLPDM